MKNFISAVGSCKAYDKNPNRVNKHIGLARVHGLTLQHVNSAISRITDCKYSISQNNSSGMKGLIVNVYCSKSSITKADIEGFFDELNLILASMQTTRKLEEQLAADRPERRMKARPVRISAQQRRA